MSKFSYVSTGFTSGLGAIARPYVEGALEGWHHIMVCRNPGNLIESETFTIIKCDLSSIASVKKGAQKIRGLVKEGKVPPLKYVFHNAGLSNVNRTTKSVEGYEMTFQVNVIAVYLLLEPLMPLLKSQPGGRVFVTGSNAHYGDIKEINHGLVPDPHWNDENLDEVVLPIKNSLEEDPSSMTAGVRAYATSKLGLVYLIHKLARDNKDIKFIIYQPGFVPGTGLGREAGVVMSVVLKGLSLVFRLLGWTITAECAGREMGQNMVSDKLYDKVHNVVYCDVGKITKSSDASYNEAREDQLWTFLTNLSV